MITELRIFILKCARCGKIRREEAVDEYAAQVAAQAAGWYVHERERGCPIYCQDCKPDEKKGSEG